MSWVHCTDVSMGQKMLSDCKGAMPPYSLMHCLSRKQSSQQSVSLTLAREGTELVKHALITHVAEGTGSTGGGNGAMD